VWVMSFHSPPSTQSTRPCILSFSRPERFTSEPICMPDLSSSGPNVAPCACGSSHRTDLRHSVGCTKLPSDFLPLNLQTGRSVLGRSQGHVRLRLFRAHRRGFEPAHRALRWQSFAGTVDWCGRCRQFRGQQYRQFSGGDLPGTKPARRHPRHGSVCR